MAIDMLYEDKSGKIVIDDMYRCYDLQNFGEVKLKWAFDVRGTDKPLIIDNDDR